MKKIKILEIANVDFVVEKFLTPLIDKLSIEGFETHIVCSDGKRVRKLINKGYNIKTITISRRVFKLSNVISLIKIYKLIKKERYDIVHVHTPIVCVLGRIAAKIAGVPLIIYTAHGFYFHDRMGRWKRNMLIGIEKVISHFFTDLIFTVSKEDEKTVIDKRIIDKERVFYIGNGVNIKKFNINTISRDLLKKKEELGIADNKIKIICFIGRMVREKGVIDLIYAFKDVLSELPETILLIIGDNKANERDLKTKDEVASLIDKHDLKEKIIFTGYRNDISDLLAIVDIFVLPSYREGMPMSIIEAMAMGKAVVATNIRGCREEVINGKTGYLVPVKNPRKLADSILKILKNDKLAYNMGQNGRKRVEIEFNEEIVLEKQINKIREWIRIKNII
jgi:glycosyltransferase involved in cell wall biosynthesis